MIDTTSYLIDYIRLHWLEENKVEHESLIPYRGYTMLRSAIWEDLLDIANNYSDNVMFISHEQVVIEKNKFGREISKFQPVFDDKLRDQMSGLMGIIARTVITTGEDGISKYELHINSNEDEFGGSRLPYKSKTIPLTKKAFDENFGISKEEDKKEKKSVIG